MAIDVGTTKPESLDKTAPQTAPLRIKIASGPPPEPSSDALHTVRKPP